MTSTINSLTVENLDFVRGFNAARRDHLRQYVINELICHFYLDFKRVTDRFGIDPLVHFANELSELEPMLEDGLLSVDEHGIYVHNMGRLLIRRICMVFDEYLINGNQIRYSKVI